MLAIAGGLGVAVTVLSVVVWLRERKTGAPGLAQSLVLSLPPSYFPTLVLSLWLQDLALRQILVPKTLALWGTIYVACVIAIYLLRQLEIAFLATLAPAEAPSDWESPEAP